MVTVRLRCSLAWAAVCLAAVLACPAEAAAQTGKAPPRFAVAAEPDATPLGATLGGQEGGLDALTAALPRRS